jgi:hypothetical protein
MTDVRSQIAELEERRQARKDAIDAARVEQSVLDLMALDALEEEHGQGNVAMIIVQYSPGLPTFAVARAANKAQLTKYRARIKEGQPKPDATRAAEELGEQCRLYPTGELWEALATARPGILAQIGTQAISLVVGMSEEEAKNLQKP